MGMFVVARGVTIVGYFVGEQIARHTG
jgi:hypothetical protein